MGGEILAVALLAALVLSGAWFLANRAARETPRPDLAVYGDIPFVPERCVGVATRKNAPGRGMEAVASGDPFTHRQCHIHCEDRL